MLPSAEHTFGQEKFVFNDLRARIYGPFRALTEIVGNLFPPPTLLRSGHDRDDQDLAGGQGLPGDLYILAPDFRRHGRHPKADRRADVFRRPGWTIDQVNGLGSGRFC